ncbi:MAG: glutamate-1-semialdehyde 2,1-aminomutase [Sedimentisphaerales bacterium]|nr:glutamate-1-semialdehyde 2,1-aminomutase [Sedimentisphaerales bacterium]
MAETSEQLFERAKGLIPGGVNSPVRAFQAVGGVPIFMTRGRGAYLWDCQSRQYIDYVGSWGPLILGHAHPPVIEAIQAAAACGTSFGTATAGELAMAEAIIERVPSVEMVRLVNSGTEATMTAVRLARAFTRRARIVKFAGCYHGHGDGFLVQAGSGAATLGVPTSPGVTAAAAADTLIARFNDIQSVRQWTDRYGQDIAAIIVEPVVGNAGVIPPTAGFLPELRRLADDRGIVLIFDEVMTGFRLAPGGAQELYNMRPDLTTLGKIIGGGMPIGAVGGRRDIMNLLAPAGPVYQAGTLSGNPVAVAAGLASLEALTGPVYEQIETRAGQLEAGLRDNLKKLGLAWQYQRVASMGCLFFTDKCVRDFDDALRCDTAAYGRYFHAMLERGIYLPPSQFEAFFLSAAHSEADIERTIAANYESLQVVARREVAKPPIVRRELGG